MTVYSNVELPKENSEIVQSYYMNIHHKQCMSNYFYLWQKRISSSSIKWFVTTNMFLVSVQILIYTFSYWIILAEYTMATTTVC